jgi:hypothetical protein
MIPSADNDQLLRQAAFALILARHSPVTAPDIAKASGIGEEVVRPALDRLAGLGWIDRDSRGRVTGSEGLSLTDGPHRLLLDQGSFQTWCAYDALGIAAALGARATIRTTCAVCSQTLTVLMQAGTPMPSRPEIMWLSDGGSDLRKDFCTPTVLLCSGEHAATWAASHEGRGRTMSLEEAAALGGAAWAESSRLARTLGPSAIR